MKNRSKVAAALVCLLTVAFGNVSVIAQTSSDLAAYNEAASRLRGVH